MASLSTHVLNTAAGKPAAGVQVDLYRLGDTRQHVSSARTNADGRTDAPLLADGEPGVYELVFQAGTYFAESINTQSDPPFLDEVVIRFGLGADGHYHVPLLVTPWSYSTYRGS